VRAADRERSNIKASIGRFVDSTFSGHDRVDLTPGELSFLSYLNTRPAHLLSSLEVWGLGTYVTNRRTAGGSDPIKEKRRVDDGLKRTREQLEARVSMIERTSDVQKDVQRELELMQERLQNQISVAVRHAVLNYCDELKELKGDIKRLQQNVLDLAVAQSQLTSSSRTLKTSPTEPEPVIQEADGDDEHSTSNSSRSSSKRRSKLDEAGYMVTEQGEHFAVRPAEGTGVAKIQRVSFKQLNG